MNENLNLNGNADIDQALKEFEEKSATEQTQQNSGVPKIPEITQREVSGVKFETDSYKAVKFYSETNAPKMVRLVMKWSGGAIKEQKHAEYVLLGLAILMFAVSLYLFFDGGKSKPPQPSVAELEQMRQIQTDQ